MHAIDLHQPLYSTLIIVEDAALHFNIGGLFVCLFGREPGSFLGCAEVLAQSRPHSIHFLIHPYSCPPPSNISLTHYHDDDDFFFVSDDDGDNLKISFLFQIMTTCPMGMSDALKALGVEQYFSLLEYPFSSHFQGYLFCNFSIALKQSQFSTCLLSE